MKKKVKMNPELNNFRELMDFCYENYKDNIAYKYKKDPEKKPAEYINKTYADTINDVKAISTAILNNNKKISRIALIGSNRYEWVISYFGITTAGLVIAPMDKLLPEKEIKSLIKRSDVEAVIFEKKYADIFKELLADETNKLSTLICMDDIEDNEIQKLSELIK